MIVYWATKPMAIGRGIVPMRLKSAGSNVSPIPSITRARVQTIHGPENHVNTLGSTSAIPAPAKIQSGKASAASERNRGIAPTWLPLAEMGIEKQRV